jgi:prevent-host-death family protein
MTQVGVKALKDSLSEYVHRASEGERIVITDRGRPVALLSRVNETRATRAAWRLVESGMATWAGGKPRGSANPPRIPGSRAAEIVIEDRQ